MLAAGVHNLHREAVRVSRNYVTLSGDWISSIPDERRLACDDIKGDHLFLISQPVLSGVDPDRTYECNGKTYHNEYRSMNMSYGNLSNAIFGDLTGGFGFKSMAWELSDEYSLVDHIHNYSSVSVVPSITLTPQQVTGGEVSALGVFSVDTRKKPIYMNRVRMYDAPKPYIGQLKFMVLPAPPTLPDDDSFYESSRFRGWVYPDGRALDKTRFAEAYTFFGDSYGSAPDGKFRIPNITEFLKPCGASLDVDLVGVVPAHNVLLEHSHTISKLSLNGKINCSLSVESVRLAGWKYPDTAG